MHRAKKVPVGVFWSFRVTWEEGFETILGIHPLNPLLSSSPRGGDIRFSDPKAFPVKTAPVTQMAIN